jgi:T6SS, Phospholipase effector Tle1-like, catalytic domain
MALYAFDGTWNSEKDGEDRNHHNTNVVKFYQAYTARSGTKDKYVEGIGTRHQTAGKIIGGLFGAGELPRLEEAYDHLCQNWQDNDRIIDVVGFSRGAATTLDFCHMIGSRGIRRPGTADVVEANPQIRFVGVWDVVAAFGLGFLGNEVLNFGHHLSIPGSGIEYCFHALALDEKRLSFIPTRLNGAHEVWFRGVHSDIGGGNGNTGLNDITLKWMMRKAQAASLPIGDQDIQALRPDPTANPNKDMPLLDIRNIAAVDRRHYTAGDRVGWRSAPSTCPVETETDERAADQLGAGGIEVLTEELRRRMLVLWDTAVARADQPYRVTLEAIREPLLALIEGRIPLVTDDGQTLQQARIGTAQLIDLMMHEARQKGWSKPDEFFLNLALADRRHLFPFTD